jgi:hypothetical protein
MRTRWAALLTCRVLARHGRADNIDELVAFTEAAQFASVEDADLLAKAGLQPRADMPSQLGADESTALRTALEAGVAKKSAPPAAQ